MHVRYRVRPRGPRVQRTALAGSIKRHLLSIDVHGLAVIDSSAHSRLVSGERRHTRCHSCKSQSFRVHGETSRVRSIGTSRPRNSKPDWRAAECPQCLNNHPILHVGPAQRKPKNPRNRRQSSDFRTVARETGRGRPDEEADDSAQICAEEPRVKHGAAARARSPSSKECRATADVVQYDFSAKPTTRSSRPSVLL